MNTYTHKAILHTAFTTGQKKSSAVEPEFNCNISYMTAELEPWFENVPSRLAKLAKGIPNEIAVSDPHETLTFGQLDQRIENAAHVLLHYGAKMGSNVAIAAQRSVSWFVTMQAIWRIGAVYIPLNTMMPEKRLNDILARLPKSILVSDDTVSAGLKASTFIPMKTLLKRTAKAETVERIDIPVLGDHPAYVMFTSGSTGLPKAVQVQHDNLAACLCGFGKLLSIRQHDQMLALTTFSFDISVLELLLTVVHGGSIYIASIDIQRDAMALSEILSNPQLTFAQATPVTWSMALNAGWKPRPEMGMLCGGEALSQDLADQLTATGGTLWNVYGPTETTIWSTAFCMKKGDKVQLDGPIPDTSITIVDFIIGDLGQPRFGLLPESWRQLAEEVDVIYHNGALVNFIYPYSALKSINVDGTRTALELACTVRLKHFHYVSSVNALYATQSPRPYREDDRAMSESVCDPSGYSGSKWVSEGSINIARQRGVPVSIYRPGLILGHTRTGAAQGNDYLVASLKGYLAMGFYPDYALLLDIVPVDYVAAALVHISKQPASNGKFFNLFNPEQVSIRQFFDWVQDFGYILHPVPLNEGKDKILALDDTHPLYPLIPLIRDITERPYCALDPAYADELRPELELKNTLAGLAGSHIRCPTITAEYVHQVLRYLIGTGFLPATLSERFKREVVSWNG
ncbi:thioester reductase domain-containing protein [Xenorhabdus eapokensis]|uniref:Putative non-ribosomal peptide synthase n=1 Tax=Xenorhabdus eapokensis TaxID=1873482 RepID=A0A1Q5TK30_9GAMM|nr:thioester reductase domain-containing protein [Xenorhabdus eapokensis]OKP00571.1 putative non-ribosomal peptide synthase [Xenorhabdus eapokensis]